MTLNEALAFLAELFETTPEQLSPSTHKNAVRGWDSMGFLSLMAEFDDRFGIILTPAQLEKMQTIDDILQVLRDNNQLQS
jgi:acyl carrier protein